MTGLVQSTSGSSATTTLTFTFPAALTAGNSVVIALCGYYGGTVSSFTMGSTAVTFLKAASEVSGPANAEAWASYGVLAVTTVTVTTSVAGIIGWAYELNGAVTLDLSSGASGTGTSWSSGTTGTTVPYQHFTVGIGMHTGNTGSITGPASGWTNGTAYSNVASGGSHVGGVAGYQQPTTSGTYTYSGTQASSSAWAALSAAFLCAPKPSEIIGNWGGYQFSEHASAGYTGVSATFTVPSCSAGPNNSFWVGLGNVYQTGIFITYDTTKSGNSNCRPWSWWLAGAGEDWNAAAYPVAYGDSLTLTIQLTPANWYMTIANTTEGWSFTEVRSVLAVNVGSINSNGAGPVVWPYPLATAEVIVEKEESVNLSYAPVTFTSITTTPAATVAPVPIFTANTNVDQYPGPFTLSGGTGSFTMNYHAAS